MTFCLVIKVKEGLVGFSDSRVVSGSETITARKITVRETNGKHSFFLMTSGLRSVRDKALTYFNEVIEARDSHCTKLYQELNSFADQVRRVSKEDGKSLREGGLHFNLHTLVAGQFEEDSEPKAYLLYPEGNWVEVSESSPYLTIGHRGYGKPLLDRVLTFNSSLEMALKAGFLAFDATRISSNDVDYPLDVVLYKADSFKLKLTTFEKGELDHCSKNWQKNIKKAVTDMPNDWVKKVLQ